MKTLSYTLTAFLATIAVSLAAPDKDMIMGKEKAAWQAFKDKKADEFKKLLSADIRCVYAEGVSDMKGELESMQKWDMKSFTFSDYNAVSVGSDTIITTYKVVVEGMFDGKDASGTYNDGSVWKKEKGTWLGIFHTNIKADTAATTPAASP